MSGEERKLAAPSPVALTPTAGRVDVFKQHEPRATLVLADGTEFQGYSFGAQRAAAGEVSSVSTALPGHG